MKHIVNSLCVWVQITGVWLYEPGVQSRRTELVAGNEKLLKAPIDDSVSGHMRRLLPQHKRKLFLTAYVVHWRRRRCGISWCSSSCSWNRSDWQTVGKPQNEKGPALGQSGHWQVLIIHSLLLSPGNQPFTLTLTLTLTLTPMVYKWSIA